MIAFSELFTAPTSWHLFSLALASKIDQLQRDSANASTGIAKAHIEIGRINEALVKARAERDRAEQIAAGYLTTGAALELGAVIVDGQVDPAARVRIPFATLNRHGLVAGATGTGKTKTLQGIAEQLSAAGVPTLLADIKGDLTGMSRPGESNDKITARAADTGDDWQPTAFPVEFYSLGGQGTGVPIRATVSGFGPLLLAKVLGLNETQESSLGLVFHHAERAGLPLVDLSDLRAVLTYLVSDQGKAELTELGGLSKQTAGVILRELVTFADKGADRFFGEPEIDTREFLRTAPDGRGIVSLLEVPGVQDQPEVFSTFLMWLLADLFNELPEVGDTDQPRLVFFFDEAHLLFSGSSKDFREQIVRTVRLIRSKGVGIVFVTQTPKDVPDDVLAQLGSRVQHQLRAHTPDDAKALRATVSTYPTSDYDLGEVLTSLATGEAIVTVMNEDGVCEVGALDAVQGGPPTVADFDGDGEPEVAVAGSSCVSVYELFLPEGTALLQWRLLWSKPHRDESSAAVRRAADARPSTVERSSTTARIMSAAWSRSGSAHRAVGGYTPSPNDTGTSVASTSHELASSMKSRLPE